MHIFAIILILLLVIHAGTAGAGAGAGECESAASTNRFDSNGDGTVMDIQTGLTWMRSA